MSQQEANAGENTDGASEDKPRSSSGGTGSANSMPDQAPQHVPLFRPVDPDAARARAAVEQWRTFTMLLEPQPGSVEAASVCEQLIKLAAGGEGGGESVTRFTIVTKGLLAETAKRNGMSGKRSLAQALVWTMARDREEGLLDKKNKVLRDNANECREEDEDFFDDEDQAPELCGEGQVVLEQRGSTSEVAEPGDGDDTKGEGGEEEDEPDAIARKIAEREKAKLELRAARLFTTVDQDLGAPDRVYILNGFPSTEADTAQFLEENNAYYTTPSSKKKNTGTPQLAGSSGEKTVFLSALDAVIQLTTKELVTKAADGSPPCTGRSDSRPGTASSTASARDTHPLGRPSRENDDENATTLKKESVRDRSRTTSALSPFTQASGVTKTLAIAQTKGGTVWQDLSFCYINVIAPEDPKKIPPSTGSSEKPVGKVPAKAVGETKNILVIAGEFREMVTQMAFDKFDFHQWFSTAEVVTLPRRDKGIDLAQAVAEAQVAATGSLQFGGTNEGAGSAARVEGSVWNTDTALSAYSDLMLGVPEELTTVGTTLHCMIEAVMLEYTGAAPRSIKVSPPAPLAPPADASKACHDSSGVTTKSAAAPPSDGWAGNSSSPAVRSPVPSGEAEMRRASGSGCSKADSMGGTTFECTEVPAPAFPRNLILEYGDFVGERATRAALNMAANFGEERVDPRAVVGVERAAIAKLQNPRLVGQGALPRDPEQSEKDRGTEQCELLTFTDLGKKDVDRTRKVWAFAQLLNAHHPPPGNGVWSFMDRRYWDVLPRHVVQQVLRAENGTEPLFLRKYYPVTDELLVALHHRTPEGRARICSWDPCTSGSIPFNFRPSFKDWANMALPRDSSYTPRTLCALGALMDVSKADLDRAKTKSVKVFPADNSLAVLSGFVATGERWLSAFKDGHVMGLRLTELGMGPSRGSTPPNQSPMNSSRGSTADSQRGEAKQQFAARFTMAFDDDSRLVIEEGLPATAAPSRPPSSSAGKRINTSAVGAPIPTPPRERRRGKPDGYGTVSCVQTFSNGLVVTATSEGTVGMRYVSDSKRGVDGEVVAGFVPEPARFELSRAVVGRGTVVRHLRDGSTQMLFVTGDVVTRNGDKVTLTDKHGRSFRKGSKPSPANAHSKNDSAAPLHDGLLNPLGEWVPIPAITPTTSATSGNVNCKSAGQDLGGQTLRTSRITNNSCTMDEAPVTDVETGAVVWCPPGENGRAVVTFEDGVTVTRHADGTVQRWRRKEQEGSSAIELVLVECAGFASVEVDVEIQEMCSNHAKGKPVTITRGGNRVRLRAVMPNGGATLVTYDTRVTSQVCGRVVYVHSDNTEVIASDKGEVVVRPRGMWEGRPVHSVLAGPNSSMPPNCAQPDLLVGAHTFDCLKGVMAVEDTDRNRFVLDLTKTAFLKDGFAISRAGGSAAAAAAGRLPSKEKGANSRRPSSRPSSGTGGSSASDGVIIDLSGEAPGVRSDALVNNPLEPRLFVYRRDGSAQELLRNDDVQAWCASLSISSPGSLQRREYMNSTRCDDDIGVVVDVREAECCSDPHSQAGRELSFYSPMVPLPRGEGSFAALLRRRSGAVFGDEYRCEDSRDGGNSSWRTRPLPLAARVHLGSKVGSPGPDSTTPLEVCMRRAWCEHPPLSVEAAGELKRALADWGAWKQTRAAQMDRFTVHDPRPTGELEAQQAVQKLVRKAFREAKAARQKQKEKARAARALEEKEKEERKAAGASSSSKNGTGGTAGTVGTSNTADTSTMGGSGHVGGDEQEDGEEDDMDFPDSGDEEESEEIVLMREESASAYAGAGGEARGYLDTPSLRLAMVTVLGRAVKQSEATSRLLATRKRTFPGQQKASQNDIFHILLGCQAATLETASAHGPETSVAQPPRPSNAPDDQSLSNFSKEDDAMAAPVLISYHPTDTSTRHLKPPPAPRQFWDTPVGRGLNGSGVAWADGGAGHGAMDKKGDISCEPDGTKCREVEASELSANGDPNSVAFGVAPMSGDKGTDGGGRAWEDDIDELKEAQSASSQPTMCHARTVSSGLPTGSLPQENNDHLTSEMFVDGGGNELTERLIENTRRDHSQLAKDPTTGVVPTTGSLDPATAGVGETGVVGELGGSMVAQGTGAKAVKSLSQGAGGGAVVEGEEAGCLLPDNEAVMGWRAEKLTTEGARSRVFQVTPPSVPLGAIEMGRPYSVSIRVTNVGNQPARFRVDIQNLGQRTTTDDRKCVRVAGYQRGTVAAGLTVVVSLEVLSTRQGIVREVLRVIAEDGIAEISITAEAVEASDVPAIVSKAREC